MMAFMNILFWLGIMGLIDGSLGLLLQEKWQKMAGNMDIQKVALVEISIAWLLLILHFILKYGSVA